MVQFQRTTLREFLSFHGAFCVFPERMNTLTGANIAEKDPKFPHTYTHIL